MKHELNSQSTKQLLSDTLIHLAEKKPFSKITVSEIVTLCDINRKTFYYHFTDVYDLLEWHLNNEINKAISDLDSVYDLNASIAYSVKYINQHPYLKEFLEDPIAKDKITLILNKTLYPPVIELLGNIEGNQNQSFEPDFKEFLAKNFTRVIVLSILDNIENPNAFNIEKTQQYISKIFDMSMHGLFQ